MTPARCRDRDRWVVAMTFGHDAAGKLALESTVLVETNFRSPDYVFERLLWERSTYDAMMHDALLTRSADDVNDVAGFLSDPDWF